MVTWTPPRAFWAASKHADSSQRELVREVQEDHGEALKIPQNLKMSEGRYI